MLDRKVLLRVLLWALGIAAATGATAILMGTNAIVGRVTGTALIVALACGLLLPLSLMMDRARLRSAGLLGMWAVVAEFLMAMTLIWLPDWANWFGGSWRFEGGMIGTMLVLGAAGPVGMGFIKIAGTALGRVAGRVGLVLTAAVFLLSVVAIWWDAVNQSGGWWLEERLWGTALALGGLGLPAVAALVGLGAGPARYWRWLGVAAAVVAFVMALGGIWGRPEGGEAIFITVISIAVVVAHANLAMLCPLKPGQTWLLIGAIGATAATAAMVDAYAFWEDGFLPFSRLAGAAGIIAACATLALLVLARLNRGVTLENAPRDFTDIRLICPRCQRKQKLPLGHAACTTCGLRISVEIEEPRCTKCGYLLFMLTSANCPECGTPVTGAPAAAATSDGGSSPASASDTRA